MLTDMLWRRGRKRARSMQLAYLREQYETSAIYRNFGLRLDGPRSELPTAAEHCRHLLKAAAGRNVVLWPALFKVWPNWHWGMQGTGDCVSWGSGHMGDINLAIAFLNNLIGKPIGLICQESIYGFGKAELFESYRYNGQGMAGSDAYESWKKYGTLYRTKYQTASGEVDLCEYDGDRAVAWGERPRATHGVPDELEVFAAEHKAVDGCQVSDPMAGAALLEAGYSWQYCGRSYWPLSRTSDGYGTNFTSGAHCMTCVGVIRDENGFPAWWRIANVGHGDHCDGPSELAVDGFGAPPPFYQECGGWVPNRLVEPVLRAGDCYCITAVEGWPVMDLTTFGFPAEVLG